MSWIILISKFGKASLNQHYIAVTKSVMILFPPTLDIYNKSNIEHSYQKGSKQSKFSTIIIFLEA